MSAATSPVCAAPARWRWSPPRLRRRFHRTFVCAARRHGGSGFRMSTARREASHRRMRFIHTAADSTYDCRRAVARPGRRFPRWGQRAFRV
ncbi:hypothetical protein F2P81_008909 [Scophthalmus maximus]|uniref:Uncharacterized protein n=1 Tax=Scophthalmus maximus TaxID=52904 RepID=A0A6A4T058_SCOMX|nr:hypothetical protein F2P81_008909 [Scophthalmus maximus]